MRFQTLYEARWIFAVLLLLGVAGYFISLWLLLLILLLFVYTISFFRDPDRVAPSDPDAILATADGTVADIIEIDETEVLNARTRRVGIFLSVFNVHTNRAPMDGRVTYRKSHAGLCLDARHLDCTTKNRAMTWAFENPRVTLVVRQLTGMIARRIVGWSKVGDELRRGERFGMIRFGSRTEVYLPLDAVVLVKVGDRVSGGLSVIARLAKK
jgi:phosphatidylserine decarboxylase